MAVELPSGEEGAPPPRFFEYGWVDGRTSWAVIAYSSEAELSARAAGAAPPGPVKLATLAWPTDVSRGGRLRPFWWQLMDAPRMPGQRPGAPDTLLLVLGPDVTITASVPFDGGVPGHAYQVNLKVVRAAGRHVVPQRGEPLRPAMLKPVETFVRGQIREDAADLTPVIQPTAEEMEVEQLVPQTVGLTADLLTGTECARIVRQPGRCVVRQQTATRESWRVEVAQEPLGDSGSFAVEVIGLPLPDETDFISHYRVRIVACGAVTALAYQVPIDNPGLSRDPNPFGIEVSHVDVEVAWEGDQARMPDTGWVVADARGFRTIEPFAMRTASQTFALDLLVSAVEMVPIVGSFVEIGGLLYAAATGRTWLGEQVTNSDLALMGIFAIAGLVPGVSSTVLKRLQDVGGAVLPGIPLVSLNPGILVELRVFLSANGPRLLREFASRTPKETVEEIVAAMEMALKTGGKSQLAAQIGDLLLRILPATHMIDDVPAAHFVDAMSRLPIEEARGFDALADDVATEIRNVFKAAIGAGDPLQLRRQLESAGLGKLWETYYDDVTDHLVFRLFTPDFSAIREPQLAGEMVYQSLFSGFADYAARKAREGKAARQALEWIASVADGSLPAKLMEAELGPSWRTLLKPYVDRRRFAVSAELAKKFKKFASAVGGYGDLREEISGLGFGMLFQVDHILEQRFIKAMPETFQAHADDFLAFLVPWNPAVASQLEPLGVREFLYVHTEKTALMRRLIPYGQEHLLTTQEYFYAYQYVYMKLFDFKGRDFEQSLFDLFAEMNKARLAARVKGETRLIPDFVKDPEELFLRIQAAHARLGLTLDPF